MSVSLLSRGVYTPSRMACLRLSPARAAQRALPMRTMRTSARTVAPLRVADSGANALMRRVLVGGIVASGFAAHGGARAMAASSIPAPSDVGAPPKDAKVTSSGLAYKVLKPGSGSGNPGPTDKVTVDYTGWTTDGKMFDSSVTRGQNITFPLNAVIAGWTEGLQLMTPGETTRLWIPEALAYRGQPGRPAGMLVFDVSLYSVQATPKPPATPEDYAGPPASAEKTASGLASRVIKAGPPGGAKPKSTDRVTVQYSGWTCSTGELFDSSIPRGEPATFPLNRVIAGWTEGVQLMSVGETRRLWLPAALAYGNNPPPGAPAGALVFDVELLSIN